MPTTGSSRAERALLRGAFILDSLRPAKTRVSAIRTQLLHKHTSTAACPHQWRGGCWGHVVAVAGALPCVRGLAPQTRSYLRVTLQHAKRREEHQYTRRRDEHHYVTALRHTPPDWSPSASRRRGSRRRARVTAPQHRVPLAHLEGVVDQIAPENLL